MSDRDVKQTVVDAIWQVVDSTPQIKSATITGSFERNGDLCDVSDIDTVLIVDQLDAKSFASIQHEFHDTLSKPLGRFGYKLRVNATLGPLKFNEERTAVLHLMMYTPDRHRTHVIQSPFTCLDWQRSVTWRKTPLDTVYPVFGLQPHHFIGSRRGARDYLRDLTSESVTYRELVFNGDGYEEVAHHKPMTIRDRHEFGYHVMRFLMQNSLKMLRRSNQAVAADELCEAYFRIFSTGAEDFRCLFAELSRYKHSGSTAEAVPDLDARVTAFVEAFEVQFRESFETSATRHLLFRHAPTSLNRAAGLDTIFQGRTDMDIAPGDHAGITALTEAAQRLELRRAFVSPLRRTAQSMNLLKNLGAAVQTPVSDSRLTEMNYGACEGKSVAECQREFSGLFDSWKRGEDPEFPVHGENTAAVSERVQQFVQERLRPDLGDSISCTHNVVLRTLVGQLLCVPRDQWYRLRIPHLAAITVVSTKRFGVFLDLDAEVEQAMFAEFFNDQVRSS